MKSQLEYFIESIKPSVLADMKEKSRIGYKIDSENEFRLLYDLLDEVGIRCYYNVDGIPYISLPNSDESFQYAYNNSKKEYFWFNCKLMLDTENDRDIIFIELEDRQEAEEIMFKKGIEIYGQIKGL